MSPPPWDYDRFEMDLEAWANDRSDIRAVIIFGSRARSDRPADVWSDIDVVLVTSEADRYQAETAWLEQLGDVWLTFRTETPVGNFVERIVLFDEGLEVDFVPVSPARFDNLETLSADVLSIFPAGYRFLVDKDGLEAVLASFLDEQGRTDLVGTGPTETEFVETIHQGLYRIFWTTKKLRRGELWTARRGIERHLLDDCVLALLRWHASAVHGRQPWHEGRFLEEWADERALDALAGAVADYDEQDCRRALFETVELVHWLGRETAAALGYPYPEEAQDRVTILVEELAVDIPEDS